MDHGFCICSALGENARKFSKVVFLLCTPVSSACEFQLGALIFLTSCPFSQTFYSSYNI